MGRIRRQAHRAARSSTADDYLALWRCNEAAAFDDFVDAMGIRDLAAAGAGSNNAVSVFDDSAAPSATRGARNFNGTDEFGVRLAPDGDESLIQTLSWGVHGWFDIDTLGNASLLELGAYSSPETQATNVQLGFQTRTTGVLRMLWENGAGVNVVTDTAAGVVTTGVHALGVACEPDPLRHNKARLRFYVDGACVGIFDNLDPMDGGADAMWILGASWNAATGGGVNPGALFDGRMDDVIVAKWSPKHEWFRTLYADGISQFIQGCNEIAIVPGVGIGRRTALQEVYTRVLVEVAPSGTYTGPSPSGFPSNGFCGLSLVNLTDLDLSDLGGLGIDLVLSTEVFDSVDDSGLGARIKLSPRWAWFNLSPKLNNSSALSTLFAERRRIKIEKAYVPCGTTRDGVGPHWQLIFDGWAMSPNLAAGDTALTLLGPDAALKQAWIEPATDFDANIGTDRVFGDPGGRSLELCMQDLIDQMDPALFEILRIDDDGGANKLTIAVFDDGVEHGRGRVHQIEAGDSLLVEGTVNFNGVWTASALTDANTVHTVEASGGGLAAETVGTVRMTAIHSYRGGKPTVWVPTSPGWNLYEFNEPASKFVMPTIDDWADEIGWAIRFRWDDVRQEFRLKLYDGRVSVSSAAAVIRSDSMYVPRYVSLKHEYQRTAGEVEYPSQAHLDNNGERTRWVVGGARGARNGDRYYFHVANGTKSLVTASTEAQLELDTLLDDMSGAPVDNADLEVPLPADSLFDIGDDVDIVAESAALTQQPLMLDDVGAHAIVVGYKHEGSRGRERTTLTMSKYGSDGTVATHRRDHHLLHRIAPIGSVGGIGLAAPATPAAPTVVSLGVLGATTSLLITWPYPFGDLNRAHMMMEVHSSTSTGFTPSAATLKRNEPGTGAVISGYTGGTTYYVKLIARDLMGNRSSPSAQTTIVA